MIRKSSLIYLVTLFSRFGAVGGGMRMVQLTLFAVSKAIPFVYNLILLFPSDKAQALRALGASVHKTASIRGRVRVRNPFALEIGRGVSIHNLDI
ncbi:MAG: hypothetical protein D6808_01290, partial [Candidatus Dadabacteria bacterium]